MAIKEKPADFMSIKVACEFHGDQSSLLITFMVKLHGDQSRVALHEACELHVDQSGP